MSDVPQVADDKTAAEVAEALHGAVVDASPHPDKLTNDFLYLIELLSEAAGQLDDYADDNEAARWAVAHWCQEVGYVPDLSAWGDGQIVPPGEVPDAEGDA